MNLAMIMIPKVCTIFLRENQTVRQGCEIMKQHKLHHAQHITTHINNTWNGVVAWATTPFSVNSDNP